MTNLIDIPLATASQILPLHILLPLLIAIICFLVKSSNIAKWLSIATGILHLLFAVVLVSLAVSQNGAAFTYSMSGWEAPLGISLTLNAFSAIMLLMSATISLAITIYSGHYFQDVEQARRFWPLWWLLNTALCGTFLSGDLFNLYVMLELMGLSGVSLIAINKSQSAIKAAYQYLLVGLFGSLLFLFGVALIYREYGLLDLSMLAATAQGSLLTKCALGFMSLGLILKTALYPLHFWLPDAHASAPAPVSAALSALVLKGTFYILFMLWFSVLTPATTFLGASIIGAFGALAILWGSVKAFTTDKLKLLVAYSTVAQVGYLFILFPLMYQYPTKTLGAAAYFIVAHACAKAAMFMAVGNIQRVAGHDEIKRLSGIASHMPLSIFIFAIAGVSLMGLPPSGGFIAKWIMFDSALVLAVITIVIGLNAMWILDIIDMGLVTSTLGTDQ